MDIYVFPKSISENIPKEILDSFGYKTFSDEKKALEHKLSYLMLDKILKEVYSVQNRNIVLRNSKPFLENESKCFSISHSREYIALAVSDFNCGIDIEKHLPRDFKSISERMNFKSDSLEEFYDNWTKYEAVYKLGSEPKSFNTFRYKNYSVSAVSVNPGESFEICHSVGKILTFSVS